MLDKLNPLMPQAGADETKEAAIAPAVVDPATAKKVTKAAIDFESFFISNMLHQMRETQRTIAPEDSPYKDKVNQDMQDMADKTLAGSIANQRAFGIADAILRQMLPAAPVPELKKPA
jgi:flagellar protein FlgJ